MRRAVHRLISFGCGIAFNSKSLIYRCITFDGKILADRGIAIHGGVPDKMRRTLHRLVSFRCGIAFNSKSLIYSRVAFNGKILADRGIAIHGSVSNKMRRALHRLISFGCDIAFNSKSLIYRRVAFNGEILADRSIAIHGGIPDKMRRAVHRLISGNNGIFLDRDGPCSLIFFQIGKAAAQTKELGLLSRQFLGFFPFVGIVDPSSGRNELFPTIGIQKPVLIVELSDNDLVLLISFVKTKIIAASNVRSAAIAIAIVRTKINAVLRRFLQTGSICRSR